MSDRICIIGAGISGLASARALQKARLPFTCYEAGSKPGGLWRLENDNLMSNIYKALHMNTSRTRSGFSEMPMPPHYPDFPHHSLVLDYLEDYIDRFELGQFIQSQHRVEKVAPAEGGGYVVTVRRPDGTPFIERFKSVIVCNGHHWDPYRPELPGAFDGRMIHSSEYRDAAEFDEMRVLIVGAGNSACDIACDLAGRADVSMSTRSGAHIVPKYLLGKPLDTWTSNLSSRLPVAFQRALFTVLVGLTRGRQSGYAFPKPANKLGAAHPTISSDLLNAVGHGQIRVRPDVEFLEGHHVRFTDGAVEAFDAIILATGYSVTFPFFEQDFVSANENELPLYHHVVHPNHEDLFFIGLVQPLGALAPLAEAQAHWVASLLQGSAKLPGRSEMWDSIRRDQAEIARRFVRTRRHTMEVDFFRYLRRLQTATTAK